MAHCFIQEHPVRPRCVFFKLLHHTEERYLRKGRTLLVDSVLVHQGLFQLEFGGPGTSQQVFGLLLDYAHAVSTGLRLPDAGVPHLVEHVGWCLLLLNRPNFEATFGKSCTRTNQLTHP